MDDNNSDLEQLKIDRQLREQRRAMASGGASVTMKDSRVSRALGWFWGLVGAGIAGSILIAANNLYQLNLTVARGQDSDKARDERLNDHETRLRNVEREVNTIEGRVFRGLDGYEQEKKPEAKRGH